MNSQREWILSVTLSIVPFSVILMAGNEAAAEPPPEPAQRVHVRPCARIERVEETVARGKYLAHHVAQCVQCHTPRNQQGGLNHSRLFRGASIPVRGPASAKPWAAESASLAGLGNYDEAFIRHLLMRGARPNGTHPKAPMPAFRLNEQDANAVIAYLKSLE